MDCRSLLLFCVLSAGFSSVLSIRCLYPPIRYLDHACDVRNLTVLDTRSNVIVNDYTCNSSVNRQSFQLEWPFNISFTSLVRQEFKYTPFLLVVMDNTYKQLLWMVANITVYDTKQLTPLTPNYMNKPITIKPYEQPSFNPNLREHEIEFLVFQQRSQHSEYSMYQQLIPQRASYPFSLVQWLNEQYQSGVTYCGPVAGALVRILDNSPYTPYQSNPNQYDNHYYPQNNANYNGNQGSHSYPTYPSNNHNNVPSHYGYRNTAFRFGSSIGLVGVILLAYFYAM